MKSVKGTDISVISQEIFEHDPLTRVENLKVGTVLPEHTANMQVNIL